MTIAFQGQVIVAERTTPETAMNRSLFIARPIKSLNNYIQSLNNEFLLIDYNFINVKYELNCK